MNYIIQKDNVLTKEDCKYIIDYFHNNDYRPGLVKNIDGVNIYKPEKKISNTLSLNFQDLPQKIQEKIINAIGEYCHTFTYIPKHSSINIVIQQYKKGEGFNKRHVDCNNIHLCKRFLAFLVYLNTVDEGGETVFYPPFEREVKPTEGSILFFPPFWMYEHEGRMPISNDKYIITGFLNYEPLPN